MSSHSYTAFGLKIHSQIELPLSKEKNTGEPFDLKILCAKISEAIKTQSAGRLYTVLADGSVLCRIPSVASYLIHAGSEIMIDAEENAPDGAVELFLLGSALGVVLHKREGLIIHGSAVRWEDSVMIFSGASGIGKSTLAMTFVQKGAALLADDVSVIRFDSAGTPWVWPSYPQMKLWQNTLADLKIDFQNLKPIHNRSTKFNLPAEKTFQNDPVPLSAVWILERHPENAQTALNVDKLSGKDAYLYLHNNTYRIEYLSQIGNARRHFDTCARLLERVPLYRIRRPAGGCDSALLFEACKAHLPQAVHS